VNSFLAELEILFSNKFSRERAWALVIWYQGLLQVQRTRKPLLARRQRRD